MYVDASVQLHIASCCQIYSVWTALLCSLMLMSASSFILVYLNAFHDVFYLGALGPDITSSILRIEFPGRINPRVIIANRCG